MSGLDLYVGDSANFTLTDVDGERVGVDPATGSILKQILGSSYFSGSIDNDETGDSGPTFHSIQIFQPPQGSSSLVVTGIKLGQYQVGIKAYSQDGGAQPALSITGIANVGSTSSFQIQFSSTPGSSSTVARVASLQSTLADINNSLQLGLIDNAGIANALTSKIQAASSAASSGQNQTAANILGAFQNQISAQTGKHITGVAPQVLLEDADALISQLPKS
jgi:hypothetical protein